MEKMIFVNMPVTDLAGARAFYEALGFVHMPQFSDDTGAAMQWSPTIVAMLISHARWRTFTDRPICPEGSSEMGHALSVDSRAEVDRLVKAGRSAGGTADVNPVEDHGFMYSRAISDPDGHVWDMMWMDPAVAAGQAPAAEALS